MNQVTAIVNKNRFFKIKYAKKSTGEVETYVVRLGVKRWKDQAGQQCELKGIGTGTKDGYLTVYAANRRGYRSFILANILQVQQGALNAQFDVSMQNG